MVETNHAGVRVLSLFEISPNDFWQTHYRVVPTADKPTESLCGYGDPMGVLTLTSPSAKEVTCYKCKEKLDDLDSD